MQLTTINKEHVRNRAADSSSGIKFDVGDAALARLASVCRITGGKQAHEYMCSK